MNSEDVSQLFLVLSVLQPQHGRDGCVRTFIIQVTNFMPIIMKVWTYFVLYFHIFIFVWHTEAMESEFPVRISGFPQNSCIFISLMLPLLLSFCTPTQFSDALLIAQPQHYFSSALNTVPLIFFPSSSLFSHIICSNFLPSNPLHVPIRVYFPLQLFTQTLLSALPSHAALSFTYQ